jgi:molecular chaperone DnaJ
MASRDWLEKDFYKVLGVEEKASKDEIKRAYRKLAQKYHPDANKGDDGAERRFKEISEAHSILSNDEKRKEYDELRRYAGAGGSPFGFRPGSGRDVRVDFGDLFGGGDAGDIFGDIFGFGPRGRRGQDLETEAHLSFEEAVEGTTFELANGTRVRVPPGVTNGARIKVPGKGGPGPSGSPPGDLYVRTHVADHPLFKLKKNGDIEVPLPITIAEAALGAKIQVPTLDGVVTLKVPAGSRPGKVLRVKGKGGARSGGSRGDLLARIEIEVPQKLSRRERELLEEFDREHKHSPREHFERYTSGRGSRAEAAS